MVESVKKLEVVRKVLQPIGGLWNLILGSLVI